MLDAAVVPERPAALADKQFRHPDLDIRNAHRELALLPAAAVVPAHCALDRLGVDAELARLDLRGGRWGTLMTARPLLPGDGVGNDLAWSDLGRAAAPSGFELEEAVWQAFSGFLAVHRDDLAVDPDELGAPRVTASRGGELIQIYAPREIAGVPVRDSYLLASVSHGNLVLFGTHHWGDVEVSTAPRLSADEALAVAVAHLAPLAARRAAPAAELAIVPLARGEEPGAVPVGQGYRHRLVWSLALAVAGDGGSWEALVAADSGELLSFVDVNHYASLRREMGGVFPVSNDGTPPDGVEQPNWPMPFDLVSTSAGTVTGDSGGNLPGCIDGDITASLAGQFVRMSDACGAISLTSSGDLDFGTSGGTNCTTPGFGGAGNTHASRSGFYELNRIKEMARGQLPGNGWLAAQLTANMNINSTCNAFWNGVTVNFYRSGGGCGNTGELAGVFDHEWGHGMDDNDANPTISNPGEGIADVYAALRLDSSCIGRGFFQSGTCGGYGDPCLSCTGIRDVDFAQRASGNPHDVAWIDANCPFSFSSGPCGGAVHCEGAVYSEAVWDLFNRDLVAAPFNLDSNAALEIATRLTYLGGGAVGTWFQCVTPFGGCSGSGGYLNFLAADDDNGNLADGTPHMSAIFAAFDRHGIACNSPAVADSGCAGGPTAAPSVSATPGDRGATLSWGAVAGASEYEVFRTDGVFACDFGKTRVGATTGTSFTDSGLQNGRPYSYVVVPLGPAASCLGPASACDTVTPVAGPDPCGGGGAVQFGNQRFDEVIRTVALSGFSDPIVVVGPPSFNGSHASTSRVRNVTPTSFQHNLQEWDYLDGNHVIESVGYLVLERGATSLGGLAARAGSASVGTGWTTVTFAAPFAAPPVVQAQVVTVNDPSAVTTRTRNVTATGFQVRLQEEEAADGVHAAETVHWIAVQPGATTVSGRDLRVERTADAVTHNWFAVAFGGSFAEPVFLADDQTTDGGNPSDLRHRALSPTGVEVKIEEEQSADAEVNHTTEVVGWMVFGN